MKLKRSFVLACFICFTGLFTITAQTICSSTYGTQDNYIYRFAISDYSGCMVLGSGGSFYVEWSDPDTIFASKGKRPGSLNQIVNYTVNYQPDGNSYLGVYGWATDPLIEYYIVDNWGTWRPPGEGYMGTIDSDGEIYEIYRIAKINSSSPSITGPADYEQYWSVRKSKRTRGSITCRNHFNGWASLGMNVGNLQEVSFFVEGHRSSGTADVSIISSDPPPPGNTGDVNGDGLITIVDALLIAQYYVNLNPQGFDQTKADVDCNGSIDIVDALKVAQYYVNLIHSLGC
ncbi:MAG: glycoside hydrolase family 11 protein [Spirochaetales bacterium]|nr:glycoside hydrolase family 11 protein [Spirochaetales bacterium]